MRVLDLFAGIGGFSLAAHWMGWETVAFVEKEAFPQKVLAKNFPGVPIYGDIFEFDGKPFRGSVDVVCGGFPCQPFSSAGKRKGRNDERHLFPEMLRVVREVEPRWVVAENVRGLLSIESGSVYAEVVASLEGEGYEVVTFCVPASALGAPHRRDRLWIVANRRGELVREAQRETGSRRERAVSDSASCSDRNAVDAERERRQRCASGDAAKSNSDRTDNGLSQPTDSDATTNTGFQPEPLRAEADAGQPDHLASTTHAANERCVGGVSDASLASETWGEYAASAKGIRGSWEFPWPQVAAELCRVDARVPHRVDRLKALGNAVVPLIPYEIFKAIDAAENQ